MFGGGVSDMEGRVTQFCNDEKKGLGGGGGGCHSILAVWKWQGRGGREEEGHTVYLKS